jgi:hypothetical protein
VSGDSAAALRLALLVGIDRYSNFGERAQLRGCVNDVRAFEGVLRERFGFPAEGITRLENGGADRAAILGAMAALSQRARPGDAVVVLYSGHGSRVRAPGEPSGWVETVVPSDSGRAPHPNRDITDREFGAWLLKLGEVTRNITLIFDSCFSGSILRDPSGARSRWVEPDPRPVARPASTGRPAPAFRDVGPSGWLPLSDRYVLLAACRAHEQCFEVRAGEGVGADHGALSFHLRRELETARPEASYREVFEQVAALVTAAFPAQHPQLEGAGDRRLFGEDATPPPWSPAVPARWGRPRLVVEIAGDTRAAEHARALSRIARSTLLRQAEAGEPVDARIHRIAPRRVVADGGAAPGLGAVSEPVWAVVGADGGLLVPVVQAGGSAALDRLAESLEAHARFRHLLELENRALGSLLRDRVRMVLRRLQPGRAWESTGSDGAANGIVFDEGDRVAVEITNESPASLFVGVLDFGLTGRISLLYPAPGGSQALEPGASLRIGERPGEEMELFIPDGYPFAGPAGRAAAGVEHFKLVATTFEADFSALEQEGPPLHAAPRLAKTWRDDGRLHTQPGQTGATEDWTTVTRSFVLRRRF